MCPRHALTESRRCVQAMKASDGMSWAKARVLKREAPVLRPKQVNMMKNGEHGFDVKMSLELK
ncbi:hypothetical protein AnigIFM59636_001967 [Aspergillus niger]|uniref:Uncharacterized protein n=2 Tax=Aspergillus niger TaxID=5061 RepID=A2QMM2_ASPNC|nr:hypothetical protein An07g02620 [Aspergillus niger]GKZ90285.1 hypothetical protein AnigIFM59636_001967 [Aspergillus niger]CAK39350.1 hypothetical protein An07g02620 [Aspergillus niger]